jgi:iron complex transport system permease protein
VTRWSRHYRGVIPVLAVALLLVVLASARWGAVAITPGEMAAAIRKAGAPAAALTLNERIFVEIRLPRALLTALVGASLAAGGVLLQALFRNPIVEPGLVGTSSGAAFGAALYFVLGASWHVHAGAWTLPLAACAGGLLATWLVFTLSRGAGGDGGAARDSVVALLLTGIAINALFLSGVGFLSYIARDPQARSITFWNLGTLAGASWEAVGAVAVSTAIGLGVGLRQARRLNALMLGEEQARYLGVDVRRLKLLVLTANVVMVAVATAFTGVIAFVGLIVPHLLRLVRGADTRYLMLGSAFAGGIVLGLADLAARLLVAPAELPLGIVTSAVGVPAFLVLLRQRRSLV